MLTLYNPKLIADIRKTVSDIPENTTTICVLLDENVLDCYSYGKNANGIMCDNFVGSVELTAAVRLTIKTSINTYAD